MKKNLFNKFWLRVGMIVAVMTTALVGTTWAQSDYSTDYTGNVTLSTTGGTNASTCKVKINNVEYNGIKAGTSNKTGAVQIVVPSGTKYLHLHVAAWKDETVTLSVTPNTNVSPTSISLTADNGISGSGSTYPLGTQSNASTNYYKVITFTSALTAETTFTFKATSGKRFVVWGVTAEESSSQVVATPTFSPEAGTYTSAQSVTISTETSGATIYYTTDGATPTTNSSVYSSAIPVSSTTTIKAIAAKTNMTTSSVAEATYTIVSLAHAGTATDPYTVADARTAIDANVGKTSVYATGVVSEIVTAYDSGFDNITFDIIDEGGSNTLRAYRCGGSEAANVQVGDIVVVSGDLTLYGSTYEFAQGCQLVSLVRPASITLTPATITASPLGSVDDMSISYGSLNVTAASDFGIQFYDANNNAITMPDWIDATVQAEGEGYVVRYSISANTDATRTAYFKVYSGTTYSNLVTITQEAITIATLPFAFNGGRDDIADTDGLTQSGLGTDYNTSNTKLKFDSTGDEVILTFNARPGVLTFDIKGNSFSGGTFKVQASSDGETYTDVATYTTLGNTNETKTITNLAASVRFIKWVYTNRVSGNVGLGNIKLARYVAHTLTIDDPENVTITATYGDEVLSNGDEESILQGTEVTVALSIDEGYDFESLTIAGAEEGQTVTPTATSTEGVYTFTMPAYDVTVSATVVEHVEPAIASYVLATSITSGKRYVIASGTEDGTVQVMGNQASNNRPAVEAAITDGVLRVSEEYEFVIENATIGEAVGYSIYDEDVPGYLYAASSTSNYLRTQATNDNNGIWRITFAETTGAATVIALGDNTREIMRYNSGSTLFSCYASGQQPVYFFEKVEEEEPITVTIGDALYMTYVAPETVSFVDVEGLTAYLVTAKTATSVTLEQIDAIEEGVAVVLKADAAGTYTLNRSDKFDDVDVNLLQASDGSIEGGEGIYALAMKNGKVGFYPVGNDTNGDPVIIPAGKAYIDMGKGEAPVKGYYGFNFEEDDPTAIEMVNGQSSMVNEIYNLAGQRLQKMQRGINIVGGRKVLK